MILDLHREPFDGWIQAGPLWNCPALHDSIELEPQIEVQVTRCVLLDNEAQAAD
jgi:hypothetical protein